MKELGHILFKFVDPIPSTEPQPVPTQPMERFVELSTQNWACHPV